MPVLVQPAVQVQALQNELDGRGHHRRVALRAQLGHRRPHLADARRLVEKIKTLGADPTTDVAPMSYSKDPVELIETLIEHEAECTEALQASIEPTGREAKSEAIEHRLEHMIMRKQEQIDLLERARREPGS